MVGHSSIVKTFHLLLSCNMSEWTRQFLTLLIFLLIPKCRGIIVYIEYQSFSPFVGIGSSHLLSPLTSVPPPQDQGGETHSLAGDGEGGPNSDDGRETLVLCVYYNSFTCRSNQSFTFLNCILCAYIVHISIRWVFWIKKYFCNLPPPPFPTSTVL